MPPVAEEVDGAEWSLDVVVLFVTERDVLEEEFAAISARQT